MFTLINVYCFLSGPTNSLILYPCKSTKNYENTQSKSSAFRILLRHKFFKLNPGSIKWSLSVFLMFWVKYITNTHLST